MWNSRKSSWLLLAFALLFPALAGAKPASLPGWESWRNKFVSSDGRIIDTGQDGISHSEGQGVGLLFAVAANDRETFERIWHWTHIKLQKRDDFLFSWRWDARENSLSDVNNATDGDMLIAWGLLRGAQRFRRPELRSAAVRILVDVRRLLLRDGNGGKVILPAVQGFEHQTGRVLNLSYWIFPALKEFERADPSSDWRLLRESGLTLLDKSSFGRWGLPADWMLDVIPAVAAPQFPARFGYDAVRIPLYLKWAKLDTSKRMASFLRYWRHFDKTQQIPAWIDLDNNTASSYQASAGMLAVRSWIIGKSVKIPVNFSGEDYYSSTLCMLVRMAAMESARR